jgi:hypothetical protein
MIIFWLLQLKNTKRFEVHTYSLFLRQLLLFFLLKIEKYETFVVLKCIN